MNAPSTNPTKANGPLERAAGGATGQNHDTNHIAEKQLSTIRARLCLAGGQTLHVAENGAFFVTTPFGQIKKFDTLAALQAHADRCAR